MSRPTSVTLQGSKRKLKMEAGGYPVDTSGSFCNVFRAYDKKTRQRFTLKRYRAAVVSAGGFMEDVELFEREAEIWRSFDHRHILPFVGIARDPSGGMYLVSPWIERGSLWDYIRAHPNQCDRRKYLRETADALVYLHSRDLIHGDIKAQNVLISENDEALLCDFGVSRDTVLATQPILKGTTPLRFQAPELWEGFSKSMPTDVYAFGMLIYQVLSGELPFSYCGAHLDILVAVLHRDERPPCEPEHGPTGESYRHLWMVAESCWRREPSERPTMVNVHLQLSRLDDYSMNEGSLPEPSDEREESPTPEPLPIQQPHQDAALPAPTINAPILPTSPPPFQSLLISRLATISESTNVVSGVADLGGIIIFDNSSSISPHIMAGNSDIYRAALSPSQIVVAIKVLRACNVMGPEKLDRLAKKLGREMRVWKTLKHERVTPLLGFAILEIGACLISPWCANGNALEYLNKSPSVDRRRLVRTPSPVVGLPSFIIARVCFRI
ncbi:hypothetical protein FRB99_007196 [Tulasnella sp. 403]|nr:hypothetical protein FRB99_007196 [Tulasnella sp. 403]